jgi:hypothetical protein
MSTPLVTYDATTGELRSNPEGFARAHDYVASIVWEKRKRDRVRPGDRLATIQWGRGEHEALCIPDGCSGRVSDLNRTIILEELEYEPSQYLARFARE